MTKIKICGLSRPVDIDIVNEVLPDYIGFVFAKSRRQITDETAKGLKEKLNPGIQAVGVFVNDEIAHIINLCESGTIDIIQLHGEENENYIKKLKEAVSNPIIKAVRVKSEENIRNAGKFTCDYLLLDAYKDDQYGGSGETFDWRMISQIDKPYFLAGGINGENIIHAINSVKPYCIDISSGVETEGYKDRNKIIDIITKIRRTELK